jgi:hypothetical protein
MPLMVAAVGLGVAAPLVALIGLVIGAVMLAVYREAIEVRAVARLLALAVLGIPVGVFLLARADERIVLTILGVVVAGYALFSLFGPTLPRLENEIWSYPVGFFSGMLSGAFNTSGPPVIIYGQLRHWSPEVFKSNLQGYFQVLGAVVVITHALAGNLTPAVWRYFLASLPAILIGGGLGMFLSRYVNADVFRKIVLALLVLLGIRLMIP